MDSSYTEYKPINSSQNNSGWLRFRSAPNYVLTNSDMEEKNKKSDWLTSSFNSVQDLEETKKSGYNNALNSKWFSRYPRTSENIKTSRLNDGYRAQKSLAMDASYGSSGSLSSNRLHSNRLQMKIPTAMSFTLGMLSKISEVENEAEEMINTIHDQKFIVSGDAETQYYSSGLPFNSWNHSTKFVDNLNGFKREIECDDHNMILDTWGEEPRNQPRMLSHHLSLPNTSADVATMDKLLQFQDTVPCKLRAKRGFATHPRSIAERVRRTRISERMRKLQDLVPSMEKQINKSDMLDLAVQYIKELQKQHKTLSDISMKCKCSAMQKTF